MRSTDAEPHEKAVERQQQAAQQVRAAAFMFATSTLLGLVSFYPIIRGTRTDNHVMMLIGFVIALVSFKILPLDKLQELISAWRGKSK